MRLNILHILVPLHLTTAISFLRPVQQQKQQKIFKAVDFSKRIYKSSHSIELIHCDNTLYITNRGTTQKKEWLNNFDLIPIPSDLFIGKFHNGYVQQFEKLLLNKLYLKIFNEIRKKDDVVFCGHSKGASMSLLLSQHFARILPDKIFDVFTFGMPKVADVDFFQYYNNIENIRHTDFIITDDIVPMLGTSENLSSNKLSFYPLESKSMKERLDFYELHSVDRYRDAILDEDQEHFFCI